MDLAGADAPDALLAATATERGFTLVSADEGFQRFPGLETIRLVA
jgi:predicted nucleic acid-binding protein